MTNLEQPKLAWTTANECLFIDSLGRIVNKEKISRLELLKRYEKAFPNRVNWGNMDPKRVLWHLRNAIQQESGE